MKILNESRSSPPTRGRRHAFLLVSALLVGAAGAAVRWQRAPRPAASLPGGQRSSPATAASHRASTGSLEVSAPAPGATVYLDGRRAGEAPFHTEGLSAGNHKLRVEKPGLLPFEQEVLVIPGRTVRIQARLAPEGPRLRVETDVPGASVFLDRRYVGKAPIVMEDVTAGSHQLTVSAEGYEMYSESLDVSAGSREVQVRFKEVRLDETLAVVHRHGVGSCEGRLVATAAGLRYETARREDAFSVPLDSLAAVEVDYLKKNLRLKLGGGKTYNFTVKSASADPLYSFQQKLEKARKQITAR